MKVHHKVNCSFDLQPSLIYCPCEILKCWQDVKKAEKLYIRLINPTSFPVLFEKLPNPEPLTGDAQLKDVSTLSQISIILQRSVIQILEWRLGVVSSSIHQRCFHIEYGHFVSDCVTIYYYC